MKYLFSILLLIAFSTTTFSQTSGIIRTSGNSGADSLKISSDSVFLKIGGVWVFQDTLPEIATNVPNGIISSILTNDTTALHIQEVRYNLNGTYFNLGESNHVLAESGDTLRIDIIAVNSDGEVVIIQGTPGDPSLPPNYDAQTHLVVSYVYAYPDSIVVGNPTGNQKWGDGLNNSIINTNPGQVRISNGLASPGGVYLNTFGVKTGLFGLGNQWELWGGNTFTMIGKLVGLGAGTVVEVIQNINQTGTTAGVQMLGIGGLLKPNAASATPYTAFNIIPTINNGIFGTGHITGINYNPTLTALNGSPHTGLRIKSGDVVFGGITGLGGAKMLFANDTGKVYAVDTTGLFASASGVVYDTTHFRIVSGGGYDTVKLKNEPPKEYIAIITQKGSDSLIDMPIAVVIKNTIDTVLEWEYSDIGQYSLVASAGYPFKNKKTVVSVTNNASNKHTILAHQVDGEEDKIHVYTFDETGVNTDNILGSSFIYSVPLVNIIHITVYP